MIVIVHIACIELTAETGMGRISKRWQNAAEEKGYRFVHIGANEVGKYHPLVWGFFAWQYIKKINLKPNCILVHEPHAGWVPKSPNYSISIFSHGIEERSWNTLLHFQLFTPSFYAKLIPYWLRFYSQNIGFKKANTILLSNNTDKKYLEQKGIATQKVFVFRNGYNAVENRLLISEKLTASSGKKIILFNASWLPRKGIHLLVSVVNKVLLEKSNAELTIAGASQPPEYIKKMFHRSIVDRISVIPSFKESEEESIYQKAMFFFFPSYFEGQSLALTQALSAGLIIVAADNCGQSDIIEPQKNGFLFPTGDENFAADLLTKVLDTPSHELDKISLNAVNSVAHLTWKNTSFQLIEKVVSI